MQIRMPFTQGDQFGSELNERLLILVEIPVEPANVVVLTICIVVAALGAAQFIASADHRHSLREQQRGQQIPFFAFPELGDRGILSSAFHAVIQELLSEAPS